MSHQCLNVAFQYVQIFCGMMPSTSFAPTSHFYLSHYKYLSGLKILQQSCDQVNHPTVYCNLEWGKYFSVSLVFMLCVSLR